MPRLSPRLFNAAKNIHPWLPLTLRATRDLQSAKNELRWLTEHALQSSKAASRNLGWRHMLHKLCIQRSRGEPLQYLLGTEYFGHLEIACRPGVLIPR